MSDNQTTGPGHIVEANKMVPQTTDPADPFQRVIRLMAPLDIEDDRPLRSVLPGVWPTWGEFKRFMESLNAKS